jgi:hypothetical protein
MSAHMLFCFFVLEKQSLKRKAPSESAETSIAAMGDNDSSNGYNSDDDDDEDKAGGSQEQRSSVIIGTATGSGNYHDVSTEEVYSTKSHTVEMPSYLGIDGTNETGSSGRKKKKLDNMKREERNAREKERSFRISRQINELRNLLSTGGVIVPKGTKSSVLTEAANYIRMLQQHQYRSEV